MAEYFDIVDEYDMITGKAMRTDAHKRGLWHRAVYVMVFNSRGELFLQQRSDNKDTEPGLWDCSVSGHPATGQTYMEAAIREAKEEIGVNLKPEPLFYMVYEPYRHHLWIFKAEHNGPFTLDPEEIKDGRFMSLSKLRIEMKNKPNMFSPEFIEVLNSFILSESP